MEKQHYIKIGKERVPVTQEVYYAYKRPEWREWKRLQVRSDKERSFDAMLENGRQFPENRALVDDIVVDKLLLDLLFAALNTLSPDERSLINALYYQEKTLREMASEMGMSYVAVHKREKRILEKLRKFFCEG